jgi:hypothetical protein
MAGIRFETEPLFTTLKGDHIVAEFIKMVDEYVESHYAAREEVAAR